MSKNVESSVKILNSRSDLGRKIKVLNVTDDGKATIRLTNPAEVETSFNRHHLNTEFTINTLTGEINAEIKQQREILEDILKDPKNENVCHKIEDIMAIHHLVETQLDATSKINGFISLVQVITLHVLLSDKYYQTLEYNSFIETTSLIIIEYILFKLYLAISQGISKEILINKMNNDRK